MKREEYRLYIYIYIYIWGGRESIKNERGGQR